MFGYIYVIQAGPYYKIGKCLNPHGRPDAIMRRMEQHEPRLPFHPRLIGMRCCWRKELDRIEKEVHRRFKEKRHNGEWFELSVSDLQWIFTQNEIPMWEPAHWGARTVLEEIYDQFDVCEVAVIPCPS